MNPSKGTVPARWQKPVQAGSDQKESSCSYIVDETSASAFAQLSNHSVHSKRS